MSNTNGVTAEEAGLYPGGENINVPKRGSYGKWAAGTAAGILFFGGLVTGYKVLKSNYKTTDNSQKDAIVETDGVLEGFGKRPKPFPQEEYRKAVKNRDVEREVDLPKASGYTVSEDRWITPDRKLNREYDFSDINDFTLAMVEANLTRNAEYAKKNLMLPGKRFLWGGHLGSSTTEYKSELTEDVDYDREKLPREARVRGTRLHLLTIFTHSSLHPGGDIVNPYIIAEQKTHDNGKRFYLVEGL